MNDDLVSKIKAAYPIAQFVAPYTNGLRPSGRSRDFLIGRCPFHQKADDPPGKRKFWVNPSKGVCGCLVPSCPAFCDRRVDPTSKPMDVINFWARLKNMTNRDALLDLASGIAQ